MLDIASNAASSRWALQTTKGKEVSGWQACSLRIYRLDGMSVSPPSFCLGCLGNRSVRCWINRINFVKLTKEAAELK